FGSSQKKTSAKLRRGFPVVCKRLLSFSPACSHQHSAPAPLAPSPSSMTATNSLVSRQKLLEAAMRVFAESGFRGATTRRIAEAAGVNEVTLFRQFKSKAALINEVAELYARRRSEEALPEGPVTPHKEIAEWCNAHLT